MTVQANDDAIQNEDVSPESVAAIKSNREIAMEQIELANLRRMEEDTGVKLVADDPDDAPVVNDEPEAVVTPAAPEAKVVRVKVDGEERSITEDELIRSYQKNSAADRRLEEAAQLLREAEQRAAQVAAQTQVSQPAEPSKDVRDEVKETLSAIYSGDEEAATEALTKLMAKTRGGDQPTPQSPQVSVDELAFAVQEKLVFDQAVAKVQTDYPDLVSDRNLEMLTVMRSNEAIAQGVPRAQALLTAAEEVYRSIGKEPTGRSNTSDKPSKNSRLENKERLEPVRSASSTAVTPALSPEEDNPSSVIQEMAARRLGQSLPRQTG